MKSETSSRHGAAGLGLEHGPSWGLCSTLNSVWGSWEEQRLDLEEELEAASCLRSCHTALGILRGAPVPSPFV